MDASRSSFVQNEYRYESASDLAIKGTYAGARELLHDTNLNQADAQTLATALFAACNTPAKAFRVEVAKTYALTDYTSGPPCFTLDAPTFATTSAETYKASSMSIDHLKGTTTLEVRSV